MQHSDGDTVYARRVSISLPRKFLEILQHTPATNVFHKKFIYQGRSIQYCSGNSNLILKNV